MARKKEETGTENIKTDCFAYNSRKKACTALNRTYCRVENCVFYKPKDQFEAETNTKR